MNEPQVILVMLRQPKRSNPNEMRTDPLWEFGSFGCTRCHRRNLMNPKKLTELNGVHLAFAQNGPLGMKLVHVTPPVTTRHHGSFGEATWSPAEMPLTYVSAPTLTNNLEESDIPGFLDMIRHAHRGTPIAQFASKFRSRRLPLPPELGRKVLALYSRRRNTGRVSKTYIDALPYEPPRTDADREATYRQLLGEVPLAKASNRARPHREKRC